MSNTNIDNLFVKAAKTKFRFNSAKGQLATEHLFDLSLTDLNTIAVELDTEIQKAGRKSFIATKTTSTTTLEDKLEILKFVISHKQSEEEERKNKKVVAERRELLKSLRDKKAIEKLENLSEEEIEKQLAALGE